MASSCSTSKGPIQTLGSRDHDGFARKTPAKHLLLLTTAVIAVFISTGCKKVAVPNVVQQDIDQAKQTLAAARLKPGNITGALGDGSYVVSQTPGAGQQVPANSQVELTVATPGPVPDLTKSKLTDAVNTLQDMGFRVAFVKQPTLKIFGAPAVLAQSPAPATVVRRGTVVTITVGTPPDLGVLAAVVNKESAYAKLDPEYRRILDEFLK